jgi:putative ABC transport system permease protein
VDIYGAISYAVAQRTHEIGIRMALGASPGKVLRSVVAQSMSPVMAGVGIGLAASLGLTRLMAKLLYGVPASDPLTFVAVVLVLSAVALAASIVPALRALGSTHHGAAPRVSSHRLPNRAEIEIAMYSDARQVRSTRWV